MSDALPQVSVVMPAYNAENYIEKAIRSVQAQTYTGMWELLVVDDASTDHTKEKVSAFLSDGRIRYLRQPENRGVAAARNCGILQARGGYIAFLDADDWWEPGKLQVQMELLAQKAAVLCCTARELVTQDGESTGRVIHVPEAITYKMLLHTNSIPCGSVVLRTDAAKRFLFTNDEFHEDYILWLRVLKAYGTAVGIDVPMLKCRLSAGGKSRNKLHSAKMQNGSYRCVGYGRIRAFYYMVFYTINGIRKYFL